MVGALSVPLSRKVTRISVLIILEPEEGNSAGIMQE
jgi:hypothetical protein